MSTRIIHIEVSECGKKKVVVRYTSEVQEYVCMLYVEDKLVRNSDYFTDCKQDAKDTAKAMLGLKVSKPIY